MWKLLELYDEKFMFRCRETDGNFQCIMFKIRECWSETLTFSEVFERAKKLNKRVIVDERTLRETLMNTGIVKGSRSADNVFSLEYRIQKCPFYFEWRMNRQTAEEARTTIIYPLIEMTEIMYQKITDLCYFLQQKDDEIEQYKREGAVLGRRTKATERFDYEKFHAYFYKIGHSCLCLNTISKQEQDFKAPPNMKYFENYKNYENQKANERTPERNRYHRGHHRAPYRRMCLRSLGRRLEYEESSQSQSEDQCNAHESRKRHATRSRERVRESKRIHSRSNKPPKMEDAEENVEIVDQSTEDNAEGEQKIKPSSMDEDLIKKEATDPKSEIIVIPKNKSPKKGLVFDSLSNDNHAKSPVKKSQPNVDHDDDFDMNDLFTWKEICKKSTTDTCKSVEQILQGLKDLERNRTATN